MITRKKGAETVEAICVDFDGISLTSEEFKKVPNIRFLEMISGNLSGNFEDLFSELRWLSWKNCPSNLQATKVCPKNLVILDLSDSSIDECWGGWTQLKVATRLNVLNLSYCRNLSITPDLSVYISLEILILVGCTSLLSIDRSIIHLRRLKHLNLKGCVRLQMLPVELGSLEALTKLLIENCLSKSISQVPSSIGALVNLERLVLCGAIKLTTLPDSIGMLKGLAELDVSKTDIAELPNAIVNLKSLKVLKMSESSMQKLPEAIGMLEKLEEIYGVRCTRLKMIPSDIVRLPSLKILKLTHTRVGYIPKLPQSLVSLCLSSNATEKAPKISNLVRLRNLELCFTSSVYIEDFPIAGTYSPCCQLKLPSITNISSYIGCLCCPQELMLNGCQNLCHIGQLPSSLRKLRVYNCDLLEVVDLSDLSNYKNLKDLQVMCCPKLVKIQGLDKLESLEILYICGCSLLRLPDLSNCNNLCCVGQLPSSLREFTVYNCRFLEVVDLSNLSNLKNLTVLWGCPKLVEIQGLNKLESLESLILKYCHSLSHIGQLPSSLRKLMFYNCDLLEAVDLSDLSNLKDLQVEYCLKLVKIQGLDKLESLESLILKGRHSLSHIGQLPSSLRKLMVYNCDLLEVVDLSDLSNLKDLQVEYCPKLVKIQGLDKLESLESLILEDCHSLSNIGQLPSSLRKLMVYNYDLLEVVDLSYLSNLKDLQVEYCPKLVKIQGLDKLESLESLILEDCHSLSHIGQLPSSLRKLMVYNCDLLEVVDLSYLSNLKDLQVEYCLKLVKIQGLDKLESLESLILKDCDSLSHIGQLPSSLRKLMVYNCDLLEVVDLSDLSNLKDLQVEYFPKLVKIQGLDKLESLEILYISDCSLLRLPDLSNWKKLQWWNVDALTMYSARGKQVARSYDLHP